MRILAFALSILCVKFTNSDAGFDIEPTGVVFQNTYFRYLPLWEQQVPWNVPFDLYTKSNPKEPYNLIPGNQSNIKNSPMNFEDKTVFFLHGFLESSMTPDSMLIKEVFLNRTENYNVILTNMREPLAGPWYIQAIINGRKVGEYIAKFIEYLVSLGVPLDSFYVIGHSLGGQIAGKVGSSMKIGKLSRISALDPAGPFYYLASLDNRLDKGDALFVDVIHTDAGINGFDAPVGHLDFWPNGGTSSQPGCSQSEITARNPLSVFERLFCSHWRSYQWFAESVLKAEKFRALKCTSYTEFVKGVCDENEVAYMGFPATNKSQGNYFLFVKEPDLKIK